MHTIILGGTGFGKSTYAIQMANAAVAGGRSVGVLDPMLDKRWPESAFVTDDDSAFEDWAKREDNLNSWLFIDEGHDSIGATRWNDSLHWLFRYGRHYGHRVTVITQHPTDLPPIVRNQCRRLVCFNIDGDTGYRLSRQFNCEELKNTPDLQMFEFIFVHRGSGEEPTIGHITP